MINDEARKVGSCGLSLVIGVGSYMTYDVYTFIDIIELSSFHSYINLITNVEKIKY